MIITLDLDEDVLLTMKELANRRGQSIGRVLSDLARRALLDESNALERNGVPLFPKSANAAVVTPELVKRLSGDVE